ncbi:MAG: alkane 1-monooxygenase [Phaeovulum sp.]|uniref:alkane 1-monooxygenase n=1 Tax=Phaeovulum sp. TaxID=2934796 RepID=UPI0027333E0E|nr:alkane 1-monooxygenase [Phaeovulum sp.]MDP3860576.1 alkane 1-monooxygenase [Phaeovulum sp.]
MPLSPLARFTRRVPEVSAFAIATLAPLPLLVLGAFFGGAWAWGALALITLVTFALDELAALPTPDAPEGRAFPAADTLSVALALAHFAALALVVFALSGGTGLGIASSVAVYLGFGLFFGQVSNANAHELIHRADRRLFWLGMWVYISLAFGHHTSAHRLVHHRFAATEDDPSSAALGEGFWAFAPRAWKGGFVAGYEMEEGLRARSIGSARRNPYPLYLGGAGAVAVAVTLAFGWRGFLAWLALVAYAQLQLLLSDYVQHYGLRRRTGPDGRPEPIGLAHSWDAPHPASSLWMLNAPRHSDHHAHPARPYPALQLGTLGADRPILPRSLPTMAALALFPPLWRRVMDHRVRALQQA